MGSTLYAANSPRVISKVYTAGMTMLAGQFTHPSRSHDDVLISSRRALRMKKPACRNQGNSSKRGCLLAIV